MVDSLYTVRLLALLSVAVATSLVGAQRCRQYGENIIMMTAYHVYSLMIIAVDYLEQFGVRASAPAAPPACDSRPEGLQDTAFQIDASSYGAIDGVSLLGDNFPSQWCMLASVNCDPSQAGMLMYYEDDKGFGFSMGVSPDGEVRFNLRGHTFSRTEQFCDNTWKQFSVCYDGGTLVLVKNCTEAETLGRPTDPGLETTNGFLTIFANGSGDMDYSVSH